MRRVKEPERENEKLGRANEILKLVSAYFARRNSTADAVWRYFGLDGDALAARVSATRHDVTTGKALALAQRELGSSRRADPNK